MIICRGHAKPPLFEDIKIRSWKASWSWQEEHKYIEVITHPPLGQLVRSNWFPHPCSGVSHSWMTSSWGIHVPTLLSVERWDCGATEHTRTASVDGSQHALKELDTSGQKKPVIFKPVYTPVWCKVADRGQVFQCSLNSTWRSLEPSSLPLLHCHVM